MNTYYKLKVYWFACTGKWERIFGLKEDFATKEDADKYYAHKRLDLLDHYGDLRAKVTKEENNKVFYIATILHHDIRSGCTSKENHQFRTEEGFKKFLETNKNKRIETSVEFFKFED